MGINIGSDLVGAAATAGALLDALMELLSVDSTSSAVHSTGGRASFDMSNANDL